VWLGAADVVREEPCLFSEKGLKRESKIFEDRVEDKGLTKETMN
jgi:hypothetical protein